MKKYWSLIFFTKGFTANLFFNKRESVDEAYNRTFKACTDKEVQPHIIQIDDESGNRLLFMSNTLQGMKIESITDNSDDVGALRLVQIEHMKLLNKELEEKMRGDKWWDKEED